MLTVSMSRLLPPVERMDWGDRGRTVVHSRPGEMLAPVSPHGRTWDAIQ